MPERLIIVDTSVLLSYVCHPEKRYAVLEAIRTGTLTAVTCDSAVAELVDVAARHVEQYVVNRFVDEYRRIARIVPEPAKRFELRDDPEDSVFFNLAIEVTAFALVSFDAKHILSVGNPAHPQYGDLKAHAPDLKILHPKDLAVQIVQWSKV